MYFPDYKVKVAYDRFDEFFNGVRLKLLIQMRPT